MLPLLICLSLFGPVDDIRIERNFMAEHNRAMEAIPVSERAWPLYLKALEKYHPWNPPDPIDRPPLEIEPGDIRWSEVESWLAANRDAVALVKEASACPCVCVQWSDALDPELARIRGEPVEQPAEDAPLIAVLLPHLGDARRFATLLRFEARRCVAEGDSAGAASALTALIELSDQLLAEETLIGQLVGMAILSHACDAIDETLGADSTVLSASQMRALRSRLGAAHHGAPIRPRFAAERNMLLDLLQRIYTDDGHGDGQMTLAGTKRFVDFVRQANGRGIPLDDHPDDFADALLHLTVGTQIASRKDVLSEFDAWLALADEAVKRPLWDMKWDGFDEQTEKLTRDKWKYAPATIMLPAVKKSYFAACQDEQRRVATSAVLAIFEFQRARGRWPESLEELRPEYLSSLPTDMYTGDQLIYRVASDRPLLYARGVDQDDDGGTPIDRRNSPFAKGWLGKPATERPSGDWLLFPPHRAE